MTNGPLLKEILEVATRLSAPFPFVRIDLYANDTKVIVGELTFCPRGLNELLLPVAADIELAKLFGSDYRLAGRTCAESWSNV